jgi:aflatoxin B1 aldehyde reductase
MKRKFGDAVVIGASSAVQLGENLRCLEGGPLPEEVVEAFQKAWTIVKGVCVSYC